MILLIDNEPNAVLEVRCMFFRMGLHSMVCRPEDTQKMTFWPVHIVLIMRPEIFDDLPAVCRQIRTHAPYAPLAIMYRPPLGNYYQYLQLADAVFDDNVTTSHFANSMYDLYAEKNHVDVRDAIYDCVRAEAGRRYIYICGEKLPATHEQVMLTRYLIFNAPNIVSTEELLQTCFRPNKPPKPSNVHTQIFRLNQMILRGTNLRKIFYVKDCGYFLKRGT